MVMFQPQYLKPHISHKIFDENVLWKKYSHPALSFYSDCETAYKKNNKPSYRNTLLVQCAYFLQLCLHFSYCSNLHRH